EPLPDLARERDPFFALAPFFALVPLPRARLTLVAEACAAIFSASLTASSSFALPSAPLPSFSAASAASLAAFAASRSARRRFISATEGPSSFRQGFQGRPRQGTTWRRGVRPQTEQPSSIL